MLDRVRSIIDKARLKYNWSHNWFTVEQLTKLDQSDMACRLINGQCPKTLWVKHHHKTQHSNYRTSNSRELQTPSNNLEYVKKDFHFSALKARKDVPINIKELHSLSRFNKQQLKSCYMSSRQCKTRLPERAAAIT